VSGYNPLLLSDRFYASSIGSYLIISDVIKLQKMMLTGFAGMGLSKSFKIVI
jgi:hypothetical protein